MISEDERRRYWADFTIESAQARIQHPKCADRIALMEISVRDILIALATDESRLKSLVQRANAEFVPSDFELFQCPNPAGAIFQDLSAPTRAKLWHKVAEQRSAG